MECVSNTGVDEGVGSRVQVRKLLSRFCPGGALGPGASWYLQGHNSSTTPASPQIRPSQHHTAKSMDKNNVNVFNPHNIKLNIGRHIGSISRVTLIVKLVCYNALVCSLDSDATAVHRNLM